MASPSRQAKRAHPRSRGENEEIKKRYDAGEGSSPLTRGKHYLTLPARPVNGLIPAHAGKTYEAHALAIQTGAHPRSRGENSLGDMPAATQTGSSPLTRGKPRPRATLRR